MGGVHRYAVHSKVNKRPNIRSWSAGSAPFRHMAVSKHLKPEALEKVKAAEAQAKEEQSSSGILSRITAFFTSEPQDEDPPDIETDIKDFIFPRGLSQSAKFTIPILSASSASKCLRILDDMRSSGNNTFITLQLFIPNHQRNAFARVCAARRTTTQHQLQCSNPCVQSE